jgi:hypothetical protein
MNQRMEDTQDLTRLIEGGKVQAMVGQVLGGILWKNWLCIYKLETVV